MWFAVLLACSYRNKYFTIVKNKGKYLKTCLYKYIYLFVYYLLSVFFIKLISLR